MRFNKKARLICLSGVLLFSLAIVGCASQEPTTQEIIDKAAQSNIKIKSYQFGTEMSLGVDVTSEKEPIAISLKANGSGAMDVVNKQMEMSMEMKMDAPQGIQQTIPLSYYVVDDWMYIGMKIPIIGEQWTKTRADMGNMPVQDQMAQQLELLKSAVQVSKIGDEVVDGIDCHVLEVNPDLATILEWVKAQPTTNLQQLDLSNLDLAKTLDNLKVKEWISKKDLFITRAEISLNMKFNPDMRSEAQANEQANMDMQIVMKFHDYNQPVKIVLPPKALDAKETTR